MRHALTGFAYATRERPLRTILRSLPNAEEFVRSVLANMTGYRGDCQVRISTDGRGKYPDYIVEMLIFDEETGLEIIHVQSIAVFAGKTHKGELVDSTNLHRAWSWDALTFKEVQMLLGELRGITKQS
jgi:hypothetical protein